MCELVLRDEVLLEAVRECIDFDFAAVLEVVLLVLLVLVLVEVDLLAAAGVVSEKAHEHTRTTASPNTLFSPAPRCLIRPFT